MYIKQVQELNRSETKTNVSQTGISFSPRCGTGVCCEKDLLHSVYHAVALLIDTLVEILTNYHQKNEFHTFDQAVFSFLL